MQRELINDPVVKEEDKQYARQDFLTARALAINLGLEGGDL